jgi:hypothetical protein
MMIVSILQKVENIKDAIDSINSGVMQPPQ